MAELLAGRSSELLAGLLLGLAATVLCLVAWLWARRHRPGWPVPVVGLALAAAGAVGVAATGGPPAPPALSWPAMALAAALAGALLADFDRRWPGLAPPLLAVSAAGVYACVPDVEAALVVLGVALPMTLLGWPWPPGRPGHRHGAGDPDAAAPARPPSLGVAGALAAAGLLVWTVATGGAGRPGSMVGGLACLGLPAVEPLVRRLGPGRRGPLDRLDRRWRPWSALAAHLLLVAVASRVVGRVETVAQALPLAAAELAVALAAAVTLARRPMQRTPP